MNHSCLRSWKEGWDPGLKYQKQHSKTEEGWGAVGKARLGLEAWAEGFQEYLTSWVPLEVRQQCGYE